MNILNMYILNNYFFKNNNNNNNNNKFGIEKFFCKIPKLNSQGEKNDPRVLLDYSAQANIRTQPCNEYWYKDPLEYNNSQVDESPVVIYEEQLELPNYKNFGSSSYDKGLIMYSKIIKLIEDKIDFNVFDSCEELLLEPLTKKELRFPYELQFEYDVLNKKTEVDRWKVYDPSIEEKFLYKDIESPINDINILNQEFNDRFNIKQKYALDQYQLINTGLVPFQIFKYKILSILYKDKNPQKPVYIIQISFFRETDLYINTFSYIGFIENNKSLSNNVVLTDIKYIGVTATSQDLMARGLNPLEIKNEIINPNFSNAVKIEKDPDAIVALTKKTKDAFKLKNQWACFNINPDSKNVLLPYFSRSSCESSLDAFGRPKDVGIYDKPCNKNEECPFYKANKNYENEFGRCLSSGYCELPLNMKKIGYKYFVSDKLNAPLCYNCNSEKYESNTLIDTCCIKQQDEKLYPYLESPDFSFEGDSLLRFNNYNKKNCRQKVGTYDLICK